MTEDKNEILDSVGSVPKPSERQSASYSLGQKAVRGASWTAMEGVVNQFGNLLILIVMARLLEPEQFGLLAMLAIFIALSEVILDGGFSNALIQRQNSTRLDESSVFYFNLFLGLLLALILCLLSPLIASFYCQPILAELTCFMALIPIIQAFALVQRSLMSKRLEFRSQAIASVVATVLSGCVGVGMATSGWGVWALAGLQVSRTLVQTTLYWLISPWRPGLQFSIQSLRDMFAFGFQMMLACFLTTGYRNVHAAVIGRFFTAGELGFYSKGRELSSAPGRAISFAMMRVAFPLLSQIQNDHQRMANAMRRGLRTMSLIAFPTAFGLAAVADNLIPLLLTDKWSGCVPFLQLLSLAGALFPLHAIHISSLKAIGRADLILRLELAKKTVSIFSLIITLPLGLLAIVVGQAIVSFTNYLFNAYYSSSILGYSYRNQFDDLCPIVLVNLAMAGLVYGTGVILDWEPWLLLLTQITVGVACYPILAFSFLRVSSDEVIASIVTLLNRPAKRSKFN